MKSPAWMTFLYMKPLPLVALDGSSNNLMCSQNVLMNSNSSCLSDAIQVDLNPAPFQHGLDTQLKVNAPDTS